MPKHAAKNWNQTEPSDECGADEQATRRVPAEGETQRVPVGDETRRVPAEQATRRISPEEAYGVNQQRYVRPGEVPPTTLNPNARRYGQQDASQGQGYYQQDQPYQQGYAAQGQTPLRRAPQAAQSGSTAAWERQPYAGTAAPRQAPVASPPQQAYQAPAAERNPVYKKVGGAGGKGLSYVMSLVAIALRLYAICLSALVVANAVVTGAWRIRVVELTAQLTAWLPSSVSGTFVYETPLGGVLRGDFVITAVVIFVVEWLLSRKARAMRRG